MSRPPHFDEHTARQVLLVQAFEAGPELPAVWSQEDRAWATRVAREAVPAGATPAQALAERCRHVLHRLLPRDAAAARALAWRGWSAAWLPLAVLAGALTGLAIDAIGGDQIINLLAPPVWGVVLWNLAVYIFLLLSMLGGTRLWRSKTDTNPGVRYGLRAWLARQTASAGTSIKTLAAASTGRLGVSKSAAALSRYAQAWAVHGQPLGAARAALLLHAAAAALAIGLVASLYTRGLVLDYRAGWQSTFLDAPQVQRVLAALLAPAVAVTGIDVPDAATLQSLRMMPGQAATAGAAPWIHLYSALLGLLVVLPRSLLAAAALVRAVQGSRRIHLPLQEPYFQRLLRGIQGGSAVVQVLPQGAAPPPAATLALQAWLCAALGDNTRLTFATTTAYGQEDQAPQLTPAVGTTLRVVLLDLSSTPEADTHGRFVKALQQAVPGLALLLVADESAMQQRFAHLPERLQQRRAAWQALALTLGVGFASVNLQQPDLQQAELAIGRALALPPDAAAQV